jgi:hypothetical protein
MRKIVITYGVISGIIAIGLMMITMTVVMKSGDFDKGIIYGYAGIILSFVLVFFGIRAYRDQIGGGHITFGRAFGVGILIALISSLFYVVTWLLVNQSMFPDFADRYGDWQINKMTEAGKSAEEISKAQAEMDHYKEMVKNPVMHALITFTEPFPVGFLITLISSFILRRRKTA